VGACVGVDDAAVAVDGVDHEILAAHRHDCADLLAERGGRALHGHGRDDPVDAQLAAPLRARHHRGHTGRDVMRAEQRPHGAGQIPVVRADLGPTLATLCEQADLDAGRADVDAEREIVTVVTLFDQMPHVAKAGDNPEAAASRRHCVARPDRDDDRCVTQRVQPTRRPASARNVITA